MIRIAITVEAYEAIVATLPLGTVAYESQLNGKGERLTWFEEIWLSKLGDFGDEPRLDPMHSGKDERRSEAGLARRRCA
jgi:hypothetical protein